MELGISKYGITWDVQDFSTNMYMNIYIYTYMYNIFICMYINNSLQSGYLWYQYDYGRLQHQIFSPSIPSNKDRSAGSNVQCRLGGAEVQSWCFRLSVEWSQCQSPRDTWQREGPQIGKMDTEAPVFFSRWGQTASISMLPNFWKFVGLPVLKLTNITIWK